MTQFTRHGMVGLFALALASAGSAQTVEVQGITIPGTLAGQPPAPIVPGMPPRDTRPAATGAGRIRGQVVAAEDGRPLRRAQIRLMSRDIRENRTTTSDPTGRYEFKDLPPGRYTLVASKGSFVTLNYGQTRPLESGRPLELGQDQVLERVDFRLPRGGVMTGRVVDEYGEPLADVQVMPVRLQYIGGSRRPMPIGRASMTNDIGEFRIFGLPPGRYYLSATLRQGIFMLETSDDRSGYAPTYYPGTPDLASAQAVDVRAGESVTDLTLALTTVRTARVSGTALDESGRQMREGAVMVMQRGAGAFMNPMAGGGQIRPDGTFSIAGLTPGEYILRVMPMGAGGSRTFSSANVTVAGDDVDGVVLMPVPPVTIRGRVVLDGTPNVPVQPASLRLMATPVDPDMSAIPMMGPPPVLKNDFSFELKAAPGKSAIRLAAPVQGGWFLKAVRVGQEDVTDGIDLAAGGPVEEVIVELTNRPASVSGRVTNARGEAVKDFSVVVFSPDRERWAGNSRHLMLGRPDQDGRFTVRPMPAGRFLAVALDYVDETQWRDPEFLETLIPRAQPFTLSAAEAKVLDLKMVDRR